MELPGLARLKKSVQRKYLEFRGIRFVVLLLTIIILGDYRNSFLRSNAQIRVGQIPDLAMVFKKSYHNYFDAQT